MDRNTTHGAPSWMEYQGTDPKGMRNFYSDVLGWTTDEMPLPDGQKYVRIAIGGDGIGGFLPQRMEQSGWISYITVDDVDKRYKKAIGAGAKVMTEPFDVPGVGRMCQIADPSGAIVAFITYGS